MYITFIIPDCEWIGKVTDELIVLGSYDGQDSFLSIYDRKNDGDREFAVNTIKGCQIKEITIIENSVPDDVALHTMNLLAPGTNVTLAQ